MWECLCVPHLNYRPASISVISPGDTHPRLLSRNTVVVKATVELGVSCFQATCVISLFWKGEWINTWSRGDDILCCHVSGVICLHRRGHQFSVSFYVGYPMLETLSMFKGTFCFPLLFVCTWLSIDLDSGFCGKVNTLQLWRHLWKVIQIRTFVLMGNGEGSRLVFASMYHVEVWKSLLCDASPGSRFFLLQPKFHFLSRPWNHWGFWRC